MTTDQPVLSVLDLAPITEGSDAGTALRHTLDLARHAERWGYRRFWIAEHHNIPSVASSATAVVIGYVAGGTSRIRVGSGGIMLPNHSPLVIAEQFGTLEALYPGRIDLGLGRAPGGDRATSRALRRGPESADQFPDDVRRLQEYFGPRNPNAPVRAIPGEGLNVPMYMLGSSTFGAGLAAELGLPYAFASHFAPDALHAALRVYRTTFKPSATLKAPHVMIGVNVFAAATDEEAGLLFTSLQQQFLNLIRGQPHEVPPPDPDVGKRMNAFEKAHLDQMTRYSLVGSPDTVRLQLQKIVEETGADEIIATAQIYDHRARLESFRILADLAPQA